METQPLSPPHPSFFLVWSLWKPQGAPGDPRWVSEGDSERAERWNKHQQIRETGGTRSLKPSEEFVFRPINTAALIQSVCEITLKS
ncbi:hypothetical protein VZT92_016501 [Zoarces viviparus]|uniref:Uncharacterized protein n=1 Tax=Zoarces viviparus TaxID=48416 RepID=A0AAW1ETV4_ZOAVI